MPSRHAILEQHLRERYGMDPEVLGPAMIEAAVTRRLRALGMVSASQYAVRVLAEPGESAQLIEELVVPETWFYRYPKSFDLLSQHAQAWLVKQGATGMGVYRVLSAPCSTGEEAWSAVICLLEAGLKPQQIHVDAVDISVQSIALAKLATYGTHSFRGEDIPGRDRYITRREKLSVVNDAVKKMVHFHHANLLAMQGSILGEKYDVVFCRNVMIYLGVPSRKQLSALIVQSIKLGGLVFSGHSENFSLLDGRFRPAGPAQSFGYRFDPEHPKEPSPMPAPSPSVGPAGKLAFGYKTGAFKALLGSGSFPALQDLRQEQAAAPAPAPVSIRAHTAPMAPAAKPAKSAAATGPTVGQARQLADAGRLADALLVCEGALQAHGPDAETYVLLGVIHEALGDHDRAQRAYERATYLDHKHYEALVHLALLAQRRGDAAGALNYNRRASEAIGGKKK